MITIEEVMTTKLHTLSEKDSLQDAIQLMADKHIRHIPIVDAKGKLTGIVSHGDVLAATDSTLHTQDEPQSPASVPISKIMTRDVATVDENASLRSAARYLERYKYGCLPVVTKGKLKGIITDSDFIAVAIDLLEQLEEMERDTSDDYEETESPEDY